MTPRELAGELGISPSTLRAWLRREFPREPGERGPWRIDEGQAEAARAHWGALAAERRGRETEVAAAAIAALEGAARTTTAPGPAARPERDRVPATAGHAARSGRDRATAAAVARPPAATAGLLAPPGRGLEPAPRVRVRPRRPSPPAPEPPRRVRAPDTPERRRAVSRGWQIESSLFSLALLLGGLLPLGVLTNASPAWLGAGGSMVAFGLALDAYARALGGYAAHQALERGWMWACVLGGSPVVLVHAVVRRAGEPVVFEAAPLVGLAALVLMFTLLGAAASSQGMGT